MLCISNIEIREHLGGERCNRLCENMSKSTDVLYYIISSAVRCGVGIIVQKCSFEIRAIWPICLFQIVFIGKISFCYPVGLVVCLCGGLLLSIEMKQNPLIHQNRKKKKKKTMNV